MLSNVQVSEKIILYCTIKMDKTSWGTVCSRNSDQFYIVSTRSLLLGHIIHLFRFDVDSATFCRFYEPLCLNSYFFLISFLLWCSLSTRLLSLALYLSLFLSRHQTERFIYYRNLYCICLSTCFMFTYADAVQIFK